MVILLVMIHKIPIAKAYSLSVVLCFAVALMFGLQPRKDDPLQVYNHFLTHCEISDSHGRVLFRWHVEFCAPLNDGSIAMAINGEVRYFDRFGMQIWSLKLDPHHQMRWSHDQKNLFVLGSEWHIYKNQKTRFDVLFRVAKQGHIVDKFSFYDRRMDLEATLRALKVSGEKIGTVRLQYMPKNDALYQYSHLNSFYEIPPGTSFAEPALSAGNLVLNSLGLPLIFIITSDFKNILWAWSNLEVEQNLHDVEISPQGDLVLFNNQPFGKGHEVSSLDIYSFPEMILKHRVLSNERTNFYSDVRGGIEVLGNSTYLINSAWGEVYYVDKNLHVRSWFRTSLGFIQDVQVLDLQGFLMNNRFLVQ